MPVQVRDMLDMQSTDATTTGCNRLGEIDLNDRGTRQARTVQSGFKESPIAMANRLVTMWCARIGGSREF